MISSRGPSNTEMLVQYQPERVQMATRMRSWSMEFGDFGWTSAGDTQLNTSILTPLPGTTIGRHFLRLGCMVQVSSPWTFPGSGYFSVATYVGDPDEADVRNPGLDDERYMLWDTVPAWTPRARDQDVAGDAGARIGVTHAQYETRGQRTIETVNDRFSIIARPAFTPPDGVQLILFWSVKVLFFTGQPTLNS